jgi:hypothetical protein
VSLITEKPILNYAGCNLPSAAFIITIESTFIAGCQFHVHARHPRVTVVLRARARQAAETRCRRYDACVQADSSREELANAGVQNA